MSEPVLFYGGEFGFGFSNFASFVLDEAIVDEIYAANSAYDSLKVARKYEAEGKLRPDWDEVKVEIMYDIISHKHDQHPYIQKQLRESIGRELIEDSAKDAFWGRGPDWKGLNMLGKLWMRLRGERYQASC